MDILGSCRCIPYRFRSSSKIGKGNVNEEVEVLVISSQKGQGMFFPKGGWELDESLEEAACRESLEEAGVLGTIEKLLICGTNQTGGLGWAIPPNAGLALSRPCLMGATLIIHILPDLN
ncbi:hypothetical protein Ancab_018390 [Ancistrocladus abbreviatus]